MVFTYRKCIALFLSLAPTPPSADGGEKVYKRHRGEVSISTFNDTVFLALMEPLWCADTPVSSLRKLLAMLSVGRAGFRGECLEINVLERHRITHVVRASPTNAGC